MKTLVTNYIFSASSKQVTLTDYPSIKLDQILLITNVTDNEIIYNFACNNLGGTLAGNVLTLEYDTTSMSNTDRLQIFIEDYVVPTKEDTLLSVKLNLDNTNTLLNVLTSKDTTISLDVSAINLNTDNIESLINSSNTRLDNLTAKNFATSAKQDTLISLLNSLTAKQDTFNIDISSVNLNTNEIESLIKTTNFLLSSSDSNTSYLIPKAYTTVATTELTSKYFTDFNGLTGFLKNIKGINTTEDPSLPGTGVYLQIWTGSNNLTGANSKLLFTYSVESESNFDITFPDGIPVSPLWVVGSSTSITYTPAPDTLFLTITYTTE